MTKLALGLIAATAMAALAPRAGAVQLITNGGFESNGGAGSNVFTGWTEQDQAGGSGSFYVQTGTASSTSGFSVQVPPEGSFAAMTDQIGPGAHVLFQAFTVPAVVMSATLSFEYYVQNHAGAYHTPGSLDYHVSPNEEDRVDIITSAAAPFSTAPADILASVLQSSTSDPLTIPYTTLSTDLTALLQAHEGQTLVLRFGEVDNQSFYNFGVDSVSLAVTAAPEPPTLAVFVAGMAGLGMLVRRRDRRAKG